MRLKMTRIADSGSKAAVEERAPAGRRSGRRISSRETEGPTGGVGLPTVSAPPVFPYDATDRRIIALLQKDGRMSNMEIARRLGLGEATVRRRINRLLETGTLRIVAVPSPETVGLTLSAIIGVSCELGRLNEAARTIAGFTEARYLGYSTGPYDLVIEAFFYSHQHLLEFLTQRIAAIKGVTRTETAVILRVAKFSFEWELPLSDETP
jgi:Lrp/AsnC family transcriptional regulator for asnA, asnC and gidA